MPLQHKLNTDRMWESVVYSKDIAQLKGIKTGGLNIRSLIRKIDDVHVLLEASGLTTLGITESWLNYTISNEELMLPGYQMFRLDRANGHAVQGGGGIVFYGKSNRTYSCISELSLTSPDIEIMLEENTLSVT